MDCVITAGGRPTPEDPLYPYTGGKPKALLDIGGQTMLERVAAALQGARAIDDVVVVGLDEADTNQLSFARPVNFLPDQGHMVSNIRVGIEWLQVRRPEATAVVISTADIPLLTRSVVDAFVDDCRPFDYMAYYNVVTRSTLERRFPNSNRTFVRLKGAEIAGGDLAVAQTRIVDTNQALWESISNARKHAWQLARLVGFWTLLKLLTRQLTLNEVEQLAGRLVGSPVKIMISPYPELAMDVDKPHQLDLLRNA